MHFVHLILFTVYISDSLDIPSAPPSRHSDVFVPNTELDAIESSIIQTSGISVVPETLLEEVTINQGNVRGDKNNTTG